MDINSNINILRVIDIVYGTIVDGPGLRTSIYLAGCRHRCPGCHNPQSWDFNAGQDMTIEELLALIEDNDMNVTLSGGDPLYQIEPVMTLCEKIHAIGKTVWIYTGFTYEQIVADERMIRLLQCADVLVDGPFVQSLRDSGLRFKGSSNQRIIDLHRSTPENICLWHDS